MNAAVKRTRLRERCAERVRAYEKEDLIERLTNAEPRGAKICAAGLLYVTNKGGQKTLPPLFVSFRSGFLTAFPLLSQALRALFFCRSSFYSPNSTLFHDGVEQISWNCLIVVHADEKYQAVEDKVAQYLLKTMTDFSFL